MTEQNRRYVNKEIGKLLSEIWRIKGLAEPASLLLQLPSIVAGLGQEPARPRH
jgi:hypothetical protein